MSKSDEWVALLPVDSAVEPPLPYPPYRSTELRSPREPLIELPPSPLEASGPTRVSTSFRESVISDLTTQHADAPGGQRIIVSGRVLDDQRRPMADTLVEIWQANAAGRYAHLLDQWDAPLDPNFTGVGRVITDGEGRYRFVTIRPGAYPWGNHHNAWRPAHIHFSLFGPAIGTRLVTQMYFPDDPLIDLDPIANAIPMPARQRMVAHWDLETTEPSWALGYLFDIVLRGREATPMENPA